MCHVLDLQTERSSPAHVGKLAEVLNSLLHMFVYPIVFRPVVRGAYSNGSCVLSVEVSIVKILERISSSSGTVAKRYFRLIKSVEDTSISPVLYLFVL